MTRMRMTCAVLALVGAPLAGEVPLNDLIKTGRHEEAIKAMRLAQDLDAVDEAGDTPLTVAARFKNENAYDMVHVLLNLGADPNSRDGSGATPLHHASRAGVLSIVHLLVDGFGARVNVAVQIEGEEREQDETPIVWAALWGHPRIVRFLESRGGRFPSRKEFEMRYKLSAAVHRENLLAASETNVMEDPFLFHKVRAKADLMAKREMGAPPRVVEYEEERVRAMEELSRDTAWLDRDGLDLYLEATRIAFSKMRGLSGFREQLAQWNATRRGEAR